MASENETVEDIVAEMRNESHEGDESCLEWVGEKMRTYADRIEAAAKREVAELKRKVAELRECLKDAVLYNCAICDSKGKSCEVKGFCLEQRWRKALREEGCAK